MNIFQKELLLRDKPLCLVGVSAPHADTGEPEPPQRITVEEFLKSMEADKTKVSGRAEGKAS